MKLDFRVNFANGGYLFLLDLAGDTVSAPDLKVMRVKSLNLAKAGEIQIYKKEIVRCREHKNAYEQNQPT